MAVAIEKDIENLDCFRKFDQFITLCNYCHMNRCETGVNCRKRKFFMNLRYLYVENLISGENVEKLLKYFGFNYGNFYSMKTMLCSLAVIEKEKVKLNKKLEDMLKLWNVESIHL